MSELPPKESSIPRADAGRRKAAAHEACGEQPRYSQIDWRAADTIAGWENMSVERLWDEVNRRAHERYGGAPKSTYDALLWELREYGLARLQKAKCRRRLAELSDGQLSDVLAALIQIQPRWVAITDELLIALDRIRQR